MDGLQRHALLTGTCDRIHGYMGRPVNAAEQPHHRADPEALTRCSQWHNGLRIRHWVDGNSVNAYNEHGVLRAEVTITPDFSFFTTALNASGAKLVLKSQLFWMSMSTVWLAFGVADETDL